MRVPTPATAPPAARAARTSTRTALLTAAGLLLLPLAGCAGQPGEPTPPGPAPAGGPVTSGSAGTVPTGTPGPSSTSARPPLSNTRPPTAGPAAKPPSEPTDQRRNDVVGGTVTRGGPGPCYGMVTDDGVEYALYGRDAGTLTTGSRLVVQVGALLLKVDCGPGRPASIIEVRSGG